MGAPAPTSVASVIVSNRWPGATFSVSHMYGCGGRYPSLAITVMGMPCRWAGRIISPSFIHRNRTRSPFLKTNGWVGGSSCR